MLANGTKLGYSTTDGNGATYTDIPELQTVPDFDADAEKVENTVLSASNKTYEKGISDYKDLEYGLKYENTSATSSYRVLRGHATSNTKLYWKQVYPDGTAFTFAGYPSIGTTGGKVNDLINTKLKITLDSDVVVTDPA